jgi:hypothetical protein
MHTDPEGFEEHLASVRPIDEEQARLLSVLRAARGRPVTFAELHELGIGNPAVLCYELEIAGVPVTRVERPRIGGAPVPVGVQLDERWFAAPPAPERAGRARWALSGELLRHWRGVLATMLAALLARSARLAEELRTPAGALREQATGLGERSRALAATAHARVSERQHREREVRTRRPTRAPSALLAQSRALAGSTLALVAERWQHVRAASKLAPARGATAAPPRSRTALLAGALALVAVVAIAAMVGSGGASHGPSARVGAHPHGARAGSDSLAAAGRAGGQLGTASAPSDGGSSTPGGSATAKPSTTSGEGTRATQLQSEGHQLLDEGRYAAAASDLRAAIAASDGSPGRCQEPSSEACLAYAYALYDLGRALQAQHNPGAAVPILNKRLRIDNQRSTVLAQLNSARAQLHQSTGTAPAAHHQAAKTHEQAQTRRATQPPRAGAPETTGEQPQTQTQSGTPTGEGHAGETSAAPTGEAGSAPSAAGEAPSAPGGGTRG